MKLTRYLTESKINFKVKDIKDSFYNNPQMVGHRIAKERVDQLEELFNKIIKTKKQKLLLSLIVNLENIDWHYFCNVILKKDIQIYSYILRRIDNTSPFKLFLWHNDKSGMLKSPLTHILEYLSYIGNEKKEYLEMYSRNLKFYGLSGEEAIKKFDEYHKMLEKKYDYIKELKKKWK